MSHTAMKRALIVLTLLAASGLASAAEAQRGRMGGTIRIGGRGMGGGRGIGGGRGRAGEGERARIRDMLDRIQNLTYVVPGTSDTLPYTVYVSSRADLKKPMPLVIALHGKGVRPETIVRAIGLEAEDRGYIVAAPMGHSVEGWYGADGLQSDSTTPVNLGELSEKDVLHVLGIMRKEFNIDSRRIYLLGQSMGGAGALHLGIKHDTIWAAVAASAPAVRASQTPLQLERVRHLPMILVHGDADLAVPVEQTRNWAAKMKELGMKYEFYEIKNGGHSEALTMGAERMFKFFNRHRKPETKAGAEPPFQAWMFQTPDAVTIDLPEPIRQRTPLANSPDSTVKGVYADLNGDGADDYAVQIPNTCGSGGCSYSLFNGATAARIGDLFGNTIVVRRETTRGFPNIDVYAHLSAQSGVVTSYVFDGTSYTSKSSQNAEGRLVEDLFTLWTQIPRWKPGR